MGLWCLFGLCRDARRQNKSIAPIKSNNSGFFLTPKLKTTGFSDTVDFRGAFVWVYWMVQASSVIIQPEIPPAFYIVCRSFVTLPNKPQGIHLVFPKSSFCILFQTIVELAETGSLDLSIFCSTCLVNYTDTDTNAGYLQQWGNVSLLFMTHADTEADQVQTLRCVQPLHRQVWPPLSLGGQLRWYEPFIPHTSIRRNKSFPNLVVFCCIKIWLTLK